MSHSAPTSLAVAGGGLIGAGVAEAAARARLDVIVWEPNDELLARSRERLLESVARAVADGRLADEEGSAMVERIVWTTELRDFAHADVVVEATVERLAVKRELFARLDAVARRARVIASCASSVPVAALASATTAPERVCGVLFASPVPTTKLVRVIAGRQTDDATLAFAESFAARLRKRAIRTSDRAGWTRMADHLSYDLISCRRTPHRSPTSPLASSRT